MIRVMYWWKVTPGREEAFTAAWAGVTRWMRAHVPGARGSLLLRSGEDPHEFVAIARWVSRAAWEASRARTPEDPELLAHVQVMKATAERARPHVFHDEMADLTLTGEGDERDMS